MSQAIYSARIQGPVPLPTCLKPAPDFAARSDFAARAHTEFAARARTSNTPDLAQAVCALRDSLTRREAARQQLEAACQHPNANAAPDMVAASSSASIFSAVRDVTIVVDGLSAGVPVVAPVTSVSMPCSATDARDVKCVAVHMQPHLMAHRRYHWQHHRHCLWLTRGAKAGSVLGHPPGEFRHLRGPAGALCLGKRQPQTYPIHFARFRARVSLDAT